MIVTNSNVKMYSDRVAVERHEKREQLTVWQDQPGGGRATVEVDGAGEGRQGVAALVQRVASEQKAIGLEISAEAKAMQPTKVAADGDEIESLDAEQSLELSIVRMLVEKVTGRRFKLFDPKEFQERVDQGERQARDAGDKATARHAEQGEQREGWGLVYDYYESHYEAESTSFSANGVVETADGKRIEFDVDLAMSREFMSETSINLRAGDALKDPLVVNFSGTAAELGSTHFRFDLDVDGREDQIAFVRSGSGFLALDRNGDGTVNDGSELFGPTSGDGFSELARYDADGNQWIDEADPIYDRLRIWTKDADGTDHLFALGDKDVGAIYLGNIATPFALKDADNQLQGQVRSSSVFLGDSGRVGTVQQLDLVV